jgi:hypothetical protein
MVQAGAPKPFWADAIELEAYVRSNTAHDIFILQGEVPEMVMSGETSDISQFCEFAFYDWIMFRDQPVAFPDDNPVLGCYLGPDRQNPQSKWGGCLQVDISRSH